jgi:hypothetical protein
LGNPRFVIFLGAIPNLLLLAGLQGLINNPPSEQGCKGFQTTIAHSAQLAAEVLPDVVHKALIIQIILVMVGIILILIALIGAIFFRRNKETSQLEPAG